jgi:hypothetical protein
MSRVHALAFPAALSLALAWSTSCGPSEGPGAEAWAFHDVTSGCGVDFRYTFGDDEFSSILEDSGSGVATFDYDGDGHLDLYFVNCVWLEGVSDPAQRENVDAVNRLYRGRGDGTFEDVTQPAGVGDGGYGMGAAVGDYDGDGDADLYVLNFGPNVMYRNDGDGSFTDVTAELGLAGPEQLNGCVKWSVNGMFLDYDRDGDLDLYVANYLAFDPAYVDPDLPEEYPYAGPNSYGGQASLLYRNDGGRFTDVTAEVGLLREGGKTMGANASDFDGDGLLDLFEAVDDMQNYLFHGRADGTFEEIAEVSGAAYDGQGNSSASMHPSIGDFDADGDMDVFVPDLEFGCLYRNEGDLRFEVVTAQVGLDPGLRASGWGSTFADFDNDADLDLLIVFGGAFSADAGELDRLFLNDGRGRFTDATKQLGPYFRTRNTGRGLALGDFDSDGDLDFAINTKDVDGAPNVVRNDLPAGNHWLRVALVGTRSNRDGIGARVELTAGGRTQVRVVSRSDAYLSQGDVRAHFGLGATTTVDSLRVRWPSGAVQDVGVEGVDRVLEVVEPGD